MDQTWEVTTDAFFRSAEEVRALMIGVREGRPVYLSDVAEVIDGPEEAESYVRIGFSRRVLEAREEPLDHPSRPAVTLALAKKSGTNAVAEALARVRSQKAAFLPEGTPLERTDVAVQDFERDLRGVPEVTSFVSYVGTASPMDFNGMVRHYDLRADGHQASIRINLATKARRAMQSHPMALRLRAGLEAIARRHDAALQIVERPPGPPVLATPHAASKYLGSAGRRGPRAL